MKRRRSAAKLLLAGRKTTKNSKQKALKYQYFKVKHQKTVDKGLSKGYAFKVISSLHTAIQIGFCFIFRQVFPSIQCF